MGRKEEKRRAKENTFENKGEGEENQVKTITVDERMRKRKGENDGREEAGKDWREERMKRKHDGKKKEG